MTVQELINKWELKQDFLAGKIGMTRALFNIKLKEDRKYCYFKKEELDKLILVLQELEKDISKLK